MTAYRCRFALDAPLTLRLHVTADERYELFLDGMRIGRGSERGDAGNWFFETYDLPLSAGVHRLTARVWSLGTQAAFAQMSVRPGFLLAPDDSRLDALVGTGAAEWETKCLGGYIFTDPLTAWGTGANLIVDGTAFDWDFAEEEGEGWMLARTGNKGADAIWRNEIEDEPLLRPAVLPPMRDEPLRVGQVRHVSAVPSQETGAIPIRAADDLPEEHTPWQILILGAASLTVPAHTRRRVLLDLENYYCAYPEVTVSGGEGSTVRVHWQESLYTDPRHSVKENRDAIEGKFFVCVWKLQDGVGDTFLPDGGQSRTFETLWWQCGRYIELLVETAAEPLTLERFILRETRYPLENESAFTASDTRLTELVPLLFRTVQMCAHETYMDCPYFEQLMYIGDTRLQSLVTFVTTSDSRLPRKAVEALGWSRLLDGLTQSRYPSRVRQIIPPFSLWWIAMVHDYALWRGEPEFIRTLMPGVRGVIDHFLEKQTASGLVEGLKGWNTLDWVPEWKDGVPPDGYDGASGTINAQFIWALTLAAELEDFLEEPEMARRDRRLAAETMARVEAVFWDEARGVLADDAAHTCFSEHTACLALLSGLLSPERRTRTARALFEDPTLSRATIYFSHYLFETCRLLNRPEEILERLSLWFDLKARGLKTTVEMPEPTRSDCHAWGAHPLFHYHATLLGVRPSAMGFSEVEIVPQLGGLTEIGGRVPHPAGWIEVEVRQGAEGLRGVVTLPPGVTGRFVSAGREYPLVPGRQEVGATA